MKSIISILLLLGIASLVFFRWFSPSISIGGDWIYYYPVSLKETFFHYSWVGFNSLGTVDLLVWRIPIDILKSLVGSLGWDSSLSDKVIIFWPTIIVANSASFLLVKKITKSNIAGFIGALVFNYNTYYFTANSAYLLYSAGAWSLLSILFLMYALEKNKFYIFVLCGLLLFITGANDFRIAYITLFIELFYFSFYAKFIENDSTLFISKLIQFFIAPVGIFIALNIYWILDFSSAHSLSSNNIVSRTLFGNQFLNILYAFTFYHPFWTGAKTTYFLNQQVVPYFWIIPILVFLSLFLHRKNTTVLFFGVVALLGIFLTKQVAYPFGQVYWLLFTYFPGFNAFREASKFYFLIALSYSVLMGAFVGYIWQHDKKIFNRNMYKVIITLVIASIFLWNAKPIVTGELGDIFIAAKIPTAYFKLNRLYYPSNSFFRTLWVPYVSSWTLYKNTNPVLYFASLKDNEWNKFLPPRNNPKETIGEEMISLLHLNYSQNLLDVSSIKYLIVPFLDTQNDLFMYYGENRNYYVEQLEKLPYLHKVNIGTNDITVFENTTYRPHVYTTAYKEDLHNKLPELDYETTYEEVNLVTYNILIKNVSKPFYLNFSENYHSGWKIRLGDFHWYDAFIKNYFLSESYHTKTNAGLNTFFMDPAVVCGGSHTGIGKDDNRRCIKNSDGTFTIKAKLYFLPQSFLNVGFIISGTALGVILGYLGIVGLRFLNNKYGKKN